MIGKQIAHYKITELIGIGGMGEVYKAADTRLDRVVALKILNERAVDDDAKRQRFLQEARVASSLNHPNILTVHEIGQDQNYYFIATEYIEGETLRLRLQRGALILPEVLELGCQIAQALETAHRSGIIHRDIKPENIMLRPDGYVKVLDFGLAKLIEPKERSTSGTHKSIKTDAGIVLGTVRYMSPEQIQHRAFDHRTDLFSLGIVLYEALTGHSPFNGQTIIDIAYEIVSASPPPLPFSEDDLTAARFTAILNRCLAKEVGQRYSDATALLKDLRQTQRQLAGQRPNTVNLPRPPALKNTTRPRIAIIWLESLASENSESWWGQAIAEALALRLACNPGLDLLANEQLWNSLTQFDAPTAGSHLAIRQLVQSWNLTHYVRGSFLPLGENLILSWHLHTVATGELISFSVRRALIAGILTAVDETAPRLEEELGVVGLDVYLPPAEALLSGSMEALQAYYQGLNYYRAAAFASAYGSLQQAVKHDNQFCLAHYYLAKSARLAEQPGYDTAIDQALDLSGRVGTYERLLIAVEKATIDQDISAQVRIAEELVRNYPQEKQGYLSLAEAYQWRGENDRAQVIFQQALELDPRLLVTGTAAGLGITSLLENYLDTNNLETAEQLLKQTILPNYSQHTGHQALGVVQYYRGVYAEANSAFMQAAERNRTAYAYPQIWQARVMLQERNFAAAMALLTNVIGRMASDDPLRGWYRWQLAEIKREQGQIQAWWAMVNDLGLTSPLLADTGFAPSYWEGYYHEQLGRYEQALNCYQQIYQQLRDNLPKMPLPSTRLRLAWAQCHYARLLAVQGKLDDVRLLIEQMHQDDQQFPHPKAERLALFLSGVLASQQGNYEMAIGLLRRSIWSQTNGFAMAIKLLAQCLRQTQEYDRALRLWQKLRPHGTLRSAAAFYLNTQVHLEIAKIYEASGQRTIALQHYRECMQVWASADKDFVSYQEAQAGVALLT